MYKYRQIIDIAENTFRVRYMDKKRKKGFTLTELIVVLVIIAIIAAVAVPFFINYWKKAEFRKNEENAKTAYLAAESRLTYYRSSGRWEAFQKEIKQAVRDGNSDKAEKAVFKDAKDSSLNGRIYTIKLNKDAKDQTKKNNLLLRLLDDYTYDKGFFDASISVEIDMESGEVYSAFYDSRCKGLNYKDDDADGYLTMKKRSYDSRSKRLLGYYSTKDTVNTVNLETKRLRITTINLVNSEKLSLNWSGNVGMDLGVDYEVAFYKNDSSKTKLFSLRVSPYDMGQKGWSTSEGSSAGMATLELTKADGTKESTGWQFPVTYNDNKYSLVLDAMMSAKVQATLDSQNADEAAKTNLEKTSSTSISRLLTVASALAEPQNIYATVKATAYTGDAKVNVNQEYRSSEQVESNVANTMFGDNTKGNNIEVTAFRHLSNMRYYAKNHPTDAATFTLTNKDMDWASAGTGVYDFRSDRQADGTSIEKLTWRENTKTETAGFPSVKELPENYTVKGEGDQTLVSNLHLNEESVADDTTTEKLSASRTEFLGLFAELKGTVENVTFRDPTLMIGQKGENDSTGDCKSLKGIGVLAGRSEGTVEDVTITATKKTSGSDAGIQVDVPRRTQDNKGTDTVGVGAMIGVLAGYNENHEFTTLASGTISGLSTEGKIEATLPDTGTLSDACGVGGIIGYAKLDNNDNTLKIKNCANHTDVSGNLCAGGIVGRLDGNFAYDKDTTYSTATLKSKANLQDSSNDGLILCTSEDKDSSTVQGNYFGGVVGYGDHALIYKAVSASGRAGNFHYSDHVKKKGTLLLGDYVGGIAGYGNSTLLANCSTEKNGYVLGNRYVGGIVGGLGEGIQEAIQAAGDVGASVTTNASYVIGNSYVGGIVGENSENVALKNCINNGVAAGYDKYVGGIVGYNQNGSTIADCASYLSDYDSSVYNMIVNDWKTTASYAGGIAGYNDGKIIFSKDSQAITVKSVSSIVVGENYVGGIAGFNDANATIDVHYTLIGGRIFAYGKCAGGAFGLNASENVLQSELTIKPQSIQGNYYVGGVIGANVVDLGRDITMNKIRTDNALGRITGNAFCGGIIGYQRTYTASQLGTGQLEDVALQMLPELGENGVPVYYGRTLARSENDNQLTITTTNNIPIRAGLYAGGIVGYCEKDSALLMKNCTNNGDIALAASKWRDGVVLSDYIGSSEIGKSGLPQDAKKVKMHFAGGIISVNLEKQIVDNCSNTGNMSGYTGSGGVVGLNAGLIYNCRLTQHFGSAALNYIGGISGINVGLTGMDKAYDGITYRSGTIQSCTTAQNKTVSGNSNVGGITGWNLNDGILKENTSYANISASGKENVGGFTGRNNGTLIVASDQDTSRNISAANATGVGGLVGRNEQNGTITVTGNGGISGEIVAVGSKVSVNGSAKVGGIVGINHGTIGKAGSGTSAKYLTCKARNVRASHGYAGGIVGETNGNITCAVNRSVIVTADEGMAGGITAVNNTGQTISDCMNYGNVTSNNGHASGIAAENAGTIDHCIVKSSNSTDTAEIYSRGGDEIGAITSYNTGIVKNSKTEKNVLLNGDATIFGGLVGVNDKQGTVGTDDVTMTLTIVPKIRSTRSNLTVGGVVGQNRKRSSVTNMQVKVSTDSVVFNGFSGYRYLGGIVGDNSGNVTQSGFSGIIKENTGAAGNCYGGIAGINQKNATLNECNIGKITMEIQGVYTATSTSTAAQKEALATHAGGVVGKNEEGALVDSCTIENHADSKFTATYGMLGGIAGFNKGTIQMSGSDVTPKVMEGVTDIENLTANASAADKGNLRADTTYIRWRDNAKIEDVTYNGDGTATSGTQAKKVSDGRLQMIMNSNGNIGGITAYNGTEGEVKQCVSGNWFLANKSEAIGVGTGGIIGMNESEKDLSELVNGAFVGRQLSKGQTNRFAGGIIGNQNNATSNEWTISNCVNYGTVYCYNTHYSGGIMGQWTGTGGNIEQCRNYGMLQTTYGTDWVGASGGIVAQLYHAYSNQEYNIVGCGNYGSIYTKEGEQYGDKCGANDSAGILGNITTYEASSASESQKFTVQILDCVNAPGVKIYSGSMASGILGFLSCDNPSLSNITNSTANTVIRIERCSNYAQVLKGYRYYGGIFGDRYGSDAWKNSMIVRNNNSVNLPANGTNANGQSYGYNGSSGQEYPIYSIGNGQGAPADMLKENRIGNYHIEGIASWGYSNVSIGEGIETLGKGSGKAENGYQEAGLKSRYTQNGFIMYDFTKGQYFVAAINERLADWTMTRVWGNSQYINEDGYIVDANGTKMATILYYIDHNTTAYNNNRLYSEGVVDPDNTLFISAKNAWRRLEGINKDTNQILGPQYAEAKVKDGKVTVQITPQKLSQSWKGSLVDNETLCDPFMYQIKVTDGTTEKIHKIYSEEDSFNIPKEMENKNVTISVRAVSMYEDVLPSEWYEIDKKNINKVLPDPDVRVELISKSGAANGHTYRFTLNNLDEYLVTDSNGNAIYPDWNVKIQVAGLGSVTLNKENPTAAMNAPYKENKAYTYQMTAQATIAGGTSTLAESSRQISTPTELPGYRPSVTLKTWNPQLKQNVTIKGNTLDELSVKVELDAGTEALNTPPIYRAELIGTWNGQENVVFAKEDILTVSAGKATATFTDLPDYIGKATDLKVRIWYASSGLGPVYTYYDVDASQLTDANVKELVDVDTDGEHWNYSHSTVLENTWVGNERYFDNYQNTTSVLWTWLPAPVLEGADQEGVLMEPAYGPDGEINYTFQWDKDISATTLAKYEVSMTGIDASGREVKIDLGDAYKEGSRTLTVDGTEWNYSQVKLKVTRIGDASKKQIGLSTTGTYNVKQRLEQPSQPTVENPDTNEFLYNVSWSQISSEDGCDGYQAYIRAYEGDTLGAEKAIGEQIATGQNKDGTYSEQADLEDYAGKRVVIYVKAKASATSAYLDSVAGITYELEIPKRLEKPNVDWQPNWTHNVNEYITADKFENGGLTVSLTAKDDMSVPPGGSAYLLKAYVYNSEEDAKAAAASDTADPGKFIQTYPTDGSIVQMDAKSTHNYEHSMKNLSIRYAGKWIVFYARISSGAGNISSKWTKSESCRLPYVKLKSPQVMSSDVEDTFTSNVTTTPNVPGTDQKWTAKRTVLNWNSVDCSDILRLSLKGTIVDTAAQGGKRSKDTDLRIQETKDGVSVQVHRQVEVEKKDGNGNTYKVMEWQWQTIEENDTADKYPEGTPVTQIHHGFDIPDYSVDIESTYQAANGGTPTYKLTLGTQLDVVQNEDGTYTYALKLPDVSDMKSADGSTVTHTNFNITDQAVFKANVTENVNEDQIIQKSEAYIESDETKIEWKK